MRPIKSQRSAVRYPLDEILGSEAHVRLLRVLINEVGTPLGAADAARLAGLTPAGARKALNRLVESGIVERVGSGRTQTYGLRERGPVTRALAELFATEQRDYEGLISSVKRAVSLPEVTFAWVEHLPLGGKEPLQISVIAETSAFTWIGEELRSRVISLEKQRSLVIEIAVFTRADAPQPEADALFLWGVQPSGDGVDRRRPQTHLEANERSLRMARIVAELIRDDPSLTRRATQHVNRLLQEGQGTADADIAEWRQLLETYSPERLRDLLVSASSRAERLRQSSPFFAVLTAAERDHVMAEIEDRR